MFARRPSQLVALGGFALALLVLAADQLTKFWVLHGLGFLEAGQGAQIEVLPPWFNLTMVWNTGVSFGMFSAESLMMRLVLIGFALGVSGLLAAWLWKAARRLQAASFGLIIGGALGNALDRAMYGAVADFLDFSGLWFPWVFNVADAAISIGVVLLLLDLVLNGDKGG
ncbi:MAG: signal peptidase II [Maricaulaceae bacterium]|nr:signal peptidase II [Maricaulaceae bacterium]